jgi:hypothetical protein
VVAHLLSDQLLERLALEDRGESFENAEKRPSPEEMQAVEQSLDDLFSKLQVQDG